MQSGGHAQQHFLLGFEQGPGEVWVLSRLEEPKAIPPVRLQVEGPRWE